MSNPLTYEIVSLSDVIVGLSNKIKAEIETENHSIVKDKDKIVLTDKILRRKIRETFKNIPEMKFECKLNNSMCDFLYGDAINREIYHSARTFLIIDNETESLMGFFTLCYKQIDISELKVEDKKELIYTGKGVNNVPYITAFLIAQICKNDLFKNKITGREILLSAMKTVENVRSSMGGKVLMLDSISNEKVIKFYSEYGFKKFSEPIEARNGEIILPMVITFKDLKLVD